MIEDVAKLLVVAKGRWPFLYLFNFYCANWWRIYNIENVCVYYVTYTENKYEFKINVTPVEGQRFSCGRSTLLLREHWGIYFFLCCGVLSLRKGGLFIVWDEYNRKLATNRLYIQLPHDHDDPIIMCIKYLYLDTFVILFMRKLLLFMLITTYINMVIQLNLNVTIPNYVRKQIIKKPSKYRHYH